MIMAALIRHFETHLGQMAGGVKLAERLSVAEFPNQPIEGISVFATIGLSHHILSLPSGKPCRMELVFCCYDRFRQAALSALDTVASQILATHSALDEGAVVRRSGSLWPGSSLTALLVYSPVYFPDTFHVDRSSSPPTVIAWLIPITSQELGIVEKHGWDKLETMLEELDPDLFDLERPSIVE
jgi:Suppressor of fused protein (SUFU)